MYAHSLPSLGWTLRRVSAAISFDYKDRRGSMMDVATGLRFADLALPRDEDAGACLDFIQAAVRVSQNRGQKRDEALARLALVQQLGYTQHIAGLDTELNMIGRSQEVGFNVMRFATIESFSPVR